MNEKDNTSPWAYVSFVLALMVCTLTVLLSWVVER